MDQKHICKMQNNKLLEDITGGNLDELESAEDILGITPKAWSMKEIIDKPDFIKSKTSALRKTVSRGWEDKPLTGEKFLQKAHLIKGCYLEYTKNT